MSYHLNLSFIKFHTAILMHKKVQQKSDTILFNSILS